MIELNRTYTEDNILTLERMPDDFLDLTVTSPPYDDMDENFVPVVKNGLRDYDGYKWDFKKLGELLYSKTKPGGVVIWVVNDPVIDGSESLASSYQKIWFRKCGFNIHDTMIYEKNGCTMPDATRYLQIFEYMIVLSKGRPKTMNFIEDRRNRFRERWGKGNVMREKDGSYTKKEKYNSNEFGRRINIWKFFTGGGYSANDDIASEHPAIFPENLAADHIRTWTNEGDVVYDCFGGSGTTGKVAHILKRNWILSEISSKYSDISKRRIEQTKNKLSLF